MASIRFDETIPASATRAWSLLREVYAAHRCFPGILTDCRQEEPRLRAVTFRSGKVVRERILDLDEGARRVAYAVENGMFSHHGASMQILPVDKARCRFVWVSDFLPDAAAPMVEGLMRQGLEAFRQALAEEAAAPSPEPDTGPDRLTGAA